MVKPVFLTSRGTYLCQIIELEVNVTTVNDLVPCIYRTNRTTVNERQFYIN